MDQPFTLDTSGWVACFGNPAAPDYRWSDLDPFTQGYIEALFPDIQSHGEHRRWVHANGVGYSDLAPETLARIIADCAARMASKDCVQNTLAGGRSFWERRQAGEREGFPPLTVTLGDDGRVYLREGR